MTAEREAAIRARAEAVTVYADSAETMAHTTGNVDGVFKAVAEAAARSAADVPYLLALVDRQATALDAVRELADRHRSGHPEYPTISLLDLRTALAAADTTSSSTTNQEDTRP